MTVDELIAALQKLSAEGHGAKPAVLVTTRYNEPAESEVESVSTARSDYGRDVVFINGE